MSTTNTVMEPERGLETVFQTTKPKLSERKALIIAKRMESGSVPEVLLCRRIVAEKDNQSEPKWEFPNCPVEPRTRHAKGCAWWHLTEGLKLKVKMEELIRLGIVEIHDEPNGEATQLVFVFGISIPAKARIMPSPTLGRQFEWFSCQEALTLLNNKQNEIWIIPVMFGKEFGEVKIVDEL